MSLLRNVSNKEITWLFPCCLQCEQTIYHRHSIRGNQWLLTVCGVIDGVHIPIQSPAGKQSELYRNRKGIFSINCQVVCEHKHKLGGQVAFTTAECGTIRSYVWNLRVNTIINDCLYTVLTYQDVPDLLPVLQVPKTWRRLALHRLNTLPSLKIRDLRH